MQTRFQPCLCAAGASNPSYNSYYFPPIYIVGAVSFHTGAVCGVYGAKFGIRERPPRSGKVSAIFSLFRKNHLENLVLRPFAMPP